jgi:hypothetical protein
MKAPLTPVWLVLLLLCGNLATPVFASEARLDLSGDPAQAAPSEASAENLTLARPVPFTKARWSKPDAHYPYVTEIPLDANTPQTIRVNFTPPATGSFDMLLRGPHRSGRTPESGKRVAIYWSNLVLSGATPADGLAAEALDAWSIDVSRGERADAGVVTAPVWLAQSGNALKVWHDASAKRSLNVVAGQRVTLTAVVGWDDPTGTFARQIRSRPPGIVEKVVLADGRELTGEIIDRDDRALYLKTEPAAEARALPLAQVKTYPRWRSTLYPADWKPGYTDASGAFLHDFSYAGYKRGEHPIPDVTGKIFDVTRPPYNADATGRTDSTAAIQKALDEAASQGGGIVYLPAGTFRVAPAPVPPDAKPNTKRAVLSLRASNIIVRGAGVEKTRVFNASYQMNRTAIFEALAPDRKGSWTVPTSVEVPLTADLPRPTHVIPVANAAVFRPGDTVVLREDMTPERIAELDMTDYWKTWGKSNPQLCRDVVAVDPAANTVTLDAPTRLPVRLRDKARLFTIGTQLSGIGFEDFSIGNIEHPLAYTQGLSHRNRPTQDTAFTNDWLLEDRNWKGKGSSFDSPDSFTYDLHATYLIALNRVRDSWIRRVNTYRPPGNTRDAHILSNGFILNDCRFITMIDCHLANPIFVGGGGNGYLVSFGGNENLLEKSTLTRARHAFSHRGGQTSGNVIIDVRIERGSGADWHMQLSPANLADNVTASEDLIEAWSYRGNGSVEHGHTTTETVIWNTRGEKYKTDIHYAIGRYFIVDSNQYGRGYVIGTRGPASDIRVDADARWGLFGEDATPECVEGVGQGATLEPQSLYRDQLSRRLQRTTEQ